MSTTPAAATAGGEATIDRDWIAAQFSKGIEAEHEMAHTAHDRASSPPEPALGVLYTQIAEADERHHTAVETVAVRYGAAPSRGLGGGITETIGRLKDKVTSIGTTPQEYVAHDLAAKANAIHWYTAWVHAFGEVGDTESARELAAILTEEKAHHDALQDVLNRMIARGARGGSVAVAGS